MTYDYASDSAKLYFNGASTITGTLLASGSETTGTANLYIGGSAASLQMQAFMVLLQRINIFRRTALQ